MPDMRNTPNQLSDTDYHAIAHAIAHGDGFATDVSPVLDPILQQVRTGADKFQRVSILQETLKASSFRDNVGKIVDRVNMIEATSDVIRSDTRYRIWTGAELHAAQFMDPEWIVDGIVPVGLTVLAGRPKIGKSWLALQLCKSICEGANILGKNVVQGRVLYLALEDNPRRMRKRMYESQRWKPTDAFRMINDIPSDTEPCVFLEEQIQEEPPALIVLDTFSRFFPTVDQNQDAGVNSRFGQLQRLALQSNCGILVIHHMRKQQETESADWMERVRGSTAICAVADAVLAMSRSRGKNDTILKGTGRDFEHDVDLSMEFDTGTFEWRSLGNSQEVNRNKSHQRILELLEELGEANGKTIAESLDLDRGNASRWLNELVDKNAVQVKDGKGSEKLYSLS